MKKYMNIVFKIALSAMLVMPILGTLGVFPPPTPDLYNTPQAFEFIQILMATKYINAIMAVVFSLSLVFLWTGRVALAALLILPITINIVAFHLVLDGGLFTAGAIMGNVLFIINMYFLWQQKSRYSQLFSK